MDVRLSRSGIARTGDPHGWNSFDHYRTIHEKRLEEHHLVDHGRLDTIEFTPAVEGTHIDCRGSIYCVGGVELEVKKTLETRRLSGVLQVRGVRYSYVAWISGGNLVLKHHNLHNDPAEFHHRVYDPATGEETGYEQLTRGQFPTLAEVLDEIGLIMESR